MCLTHHTHRPLVLMPNNKLVFCVANYAVHIVCGKRHKTTECPSFRSSVPSIDSSSGGGGFAVEVGRRQSWYWI